MGIAAESSMLRNLTPPSRACVANSVLSSKDVKPLRWVSEVAWLLRKPASGFGGTGIVELGPGISSLSSSDWKQLGLFVIPSQVDSHCIS
jgi:hypothetical protein